MRITTFKNGAYVMLEKNLVNGFYTITAKSEAGEVLDKISVDNYRSAIEYKRAFSKIAKAQR